VSGGKGVIDMKTLTLVPAYGRDYKTGLLADCAWQEGRDFEIFDVSCPWDGCYVAVGQTADLLASGYTHLNVRYNKLMCVTNIELRKPED
jgi:hypothetical protein